MARKPSLFLATCTLACATRVEITEDARETVSGPSLSGGVICGDDQLRSKLTASLSAVTAHYFVQKAEDFIQKVEVKKKEVSKVGDVMKHIAETSVSALPAVIYRRIEFLELVLEIQRCELAKVLVKQFFQSEVDLEKFKSEWDQYGLMPKVGKARNP
mmetsp:Transcript_81707/g.189783  ORF Transcript_81707/g.189783 Transcript_81707/m.189783 type:complete len:158 (-) Transcript_81707:54-527(-)